MQMDTIAHAVGRTPAANDTAADESAGQPARGRRTSASADGASSVLACQAHRFQLPRGVHYLNCAYAAPLLREVERAGRAALRRWRTPWRFPPAAYFDEAERARRLFAALIGAPDGERVAVVPSVSYGVALAAHNVNVRRGANVVIADGQFPSNVYAWRRRCGETGAELRAVPRPEQRGATAPGGGWSERLLAAIDERTAVVALGTLDWARGTLFDLAAIGARAREVGAAYVLDGTQSVGAMPFDVRRVQPDLLVCSSYKWLLGPMGVGLCYVGERFAAGTPLEETWLGRRGSEDFTALTKYADDYQAGARRFDGGGRAHFVLLPMLNAALAQLLSWGVARVQAYCARLAAPALAQLAALGCRVDGLGAEADGCESPPEARQAAHLVAVHPPPGVTPEATSAALARRRVHVSARGGALRVAPHVYNTPEDMAALVAALVAALGEASGAGGPRGR